MPAGNPITQHYASAGIADRVLAAFRAAHGRDAALTPEVLAPLDHFHGRGPVATQELVTLLQPKSGERLLDIGSGIGGPARWIATRFGVHVTGVDLTPEFCEAARALNAACAVGERVRIIEGSALDLPVPDASFDAAYSQNVIMNIADKPRFYREAFRALRPGGRLALSNVCAGPGGEPYYPAPWAATAATSFLASPEEMRADLIGAGFEIVEFRDITDAIRAVQQRNRERLERGEMPLVAADIIHGERAREMQRNSMRSAEENRTLMIEALVRKPA